MRPVIAADGLIEQVTPGSFATWRSEEVRQPTATGGDRVLCIVGLAQGGAPSEPYFITQNDDQLTKLFQSGELLQATRFALASGVSGVVAVNPAPGTPATYQIAPATGSDEFGTLETAFFREPANQTRVAIVGNATDGYAIEINNPLTGALVSSNRVGLGLYVQYNGAGTATAEVVDNAGSKLLRLAVVDGDNEDVEIPLADLTVADLIRRIQDSGPYSALYSRDARLAADTLDTTAAPIQINTYPILATVTAAAAGATSLTVTATSRAILKGEVLRARSGATWVPVSVNADAEQGATTLTVMPLSAAVPGGNLFAGRANAPKALSAVKGDFELFFATKAQGVVTFTPGAGARPSVQSGYFSGGASLAAGPEDWNDALTAAIDAFPFGQAVALQSDRSVTFGLRAQLQARRHPRHSSPVQFFEALPDFILPASESPAEMSAFVTEVLNEVASVNDRDSVVIAQSNTGNLTPTGVTGREKTYMVALRVAATRAGRGPGNSLTHATVGGTNPFPNLKDHADRLARGGVLTLESPRRNQPTRVILGRTAHVGTDDLAYESEKTVAIMNALTRGVRAIGAATVPGAGDASKLADYSRLIGEFYAQKEADGWITSGIDQYGNPVQAAEYDVQRTSFQGRLVRAVSRVNPTPEFLMADHQLVARTVDIEVTA